MQAQDTRALIQELRNTLEQQVETCRTLRSLPLERLHRRPGPDRWSVMEVVEHMNLSSGHYYRRLQALYAKPAGSLRPSDTFLPGRWGQLAVQAMNPKADGTIGWRMRTLGMFEPRTTITEGWAAFGRFEAMLAGFQELLALADKRGLEGPRITSTLGPILRFKVGDAFRFPIAHQQRHMLQIERVLQVV